MHLDFPHALGKQEAKLRLMALTQYLESKHHITTNWTGDTGHFRGKYMVVSIEGEFHIEDKLVKLRGKDPGVLWRKKALGYLQHKLETYMDPKTPVEQLPLA